MFREPSILSISGCPAKTLQGFHGYAFASSAIFISCVGTDIIAQHAQKEVGHIRNMEFFEGLEEVVTNVTNPLRKELATLVTTSYRA